MEGEVFAKIAAGISVIAGGWYAFVRKIKHDRRDDKVIALHDDAIEQVIKTLREEIEHVEAYLALEKARLDERLHIIWTVLAKEQLDHLIPTLILQPLVENAVIHGLAPKTEGGTIHIVINKVGPELLIQVDDDGVGFDVVRAARAESAETALTTERRPSIGLHNVDERLRRLYGEEHRLLIESERGRGTRVIIRIPLNADLAEHQITQSPDRLLA